MYEQERLEIFTRDRDTALATLEVSEFIKFIKKHRDTFGKNFVSHFIGASETVQKATMCKMICSIPKFYGTEVEQKAIFWLSAHKMSLGIRK